MTFKSKNGFLLGCALLVLIPVILIWSFAWPMLRPVPFPSLIKGQELQPMQRSLNGKEVDILNQWLQHHRTSWGTKGEKAPAGNPSVQFLLEGESDHKLYLSFWHFRHGDDVAGFQTEADGSFRMSSANKDELTDLIKNFPDVSWNARK